MTKKKNVIILLGLPLFIILLSCIKIYKCPISYIFGISCPMCGMTRAFISLFNFDITGAFYYHIFWPVILLLIFLYFLYVINKFEFTKKFIFILNILAVLNLIYYFYRLFNGSDIIYINFEKSLIYKVIFILKNI